MTLGEKLKTARLEAGLSQRQLCADIVTRNMLSQIENGTAQPSMTTLRRFAERLEKPLHFFLEDPPGQTAGDLAWAAYALGHYSEALDYLDGASQTGREPLLLKKLCLLALSDTAAAEGRDLYALELLEKAGDLTDPYAIPELERRRLLLLGQVSSRKSDICSLLPSLDGELFLRAGAALETGDLTRAAAVLDAVQNQETPRWQLLRGTVYRREGQYAAAVSCLTQAENAFPLETAPLMEDCFRELGDFQRAYFYACKQKR